MMLSLGMFVFSLSTLAYQQLQRQSAWRHATTSRVGARPARQYVGQGDDTITLSGLLAPELTGTLASLTKLREMGDTGDASSLVDGAGNVYGAFVIASLAETQTIFSVDGVARRIEFTLTLEHVDDHLVGRQQHPAPRRRR